MNTHTLAQILFSVLVFLLVNTTLSGQNMDDPGDFFQHVGTSTDPEFEIGFSSPPPAGTNLIWEYCVISADDSPGPLCSGGFSPGTEGGTTILPLGNGMRVQFFDSGVDKRIVVRGNPNLNFASGTPDPELEVSRVRVRFRVSGLPGGGSFSKDFEFLIRHPHQIVFILDRSGSMECPNNTDTDNLWSGCATTASPGRRWDLLKSGINNYLANYPTDGSETARNDQFGVVYFSGTDLSANDGATPINGMVNFDSFNSAINSNMSTAPVENAIPVELARDGTGIGSGITEVFSNSTFFGSGNDATARQLAVVFTDGEENRNTVDYLTAGDRIIRASAGASDFNLDCDATDASAPGPAGCIQNDLIELFSIGANSMPVGASQSIIDFLASTDTDPDNTDQLFWSSTHEFAPFRDPTFFTNLSSNLYNSINGVYSPDLIDFENQTLALSHSKTFTVNQNVARLIFDAHFNYPVGDTLFDYFLEKDGVDVTDLAELVIDPYFGKLKVEFQDLEDFSSQGNWSLILRSKNNFVPEVEPGFELPQVRLQAIAEDRNFKISASPGDGPIRVNGRLEPTITLSKRGNPISIATAFAEIFFPNDDGGNILGRSPQIDPSSDPEAGGIASQKYVNIQQENPEALIELENTNRRRIPLNHIGNGVYQGLFDSLRVSGTYKIIYRIELEDGELGTLVRAEEQSLYVKFGEVDPELNPEEQNVTINETSDGNFANLTVRPAYLSKDINFQDSVFLVGPGCDYCFDVNGEGVDLSSVRDIGDGSYELRLNLNNNRNPDIQIDLLGDKIYDGPIEEFPISEKNRPWGLSLHGGVSYPLYGLDNTYDNGYFIEGDISYRLSRFFSLELIGGYYSFETDYEIIGGSLYAKLHLPIGKFTPSIAAGGGLYQPKGEDFSGAFSFRGSLARRIAPRLYLSIDGTYTQLPGPDYTFGTLGLGLKLRL